MIISPHIYSETESDKEEDGSIPESQMFMDTQFEKANNTNENIAPSTTAQTDDMPKSRDIKKDEAKNFLDANTTEMTDLGKTDTDTAKSASGSTDCKSLGGEKPKLKSLITVS